MRNLDRCCDEGLPGTVDCSSGLEDGEGWSGMRQHDVGVSSNASEGTESESGMPGKAAASGAQTIGDAEYDESASSQVE